MSLLTVNIAAKMTAANRKSLAHDEAILAEEAKLKAEVSKLISESTELAKAEDRVDLMKTLGLYYHGEEATRVHKARASWGHLPQDRIFTVEAIRDICVKYDLRFLNTQYYRGTLDEGIGAAVEELKSLNRGQLPSYPCSGIAAFYISAPKASFVLSERPKDPLLFCQLDRNHFYLVHKWGSDLSVFRRAWGFWKNWWQIITPVVLTGTVFGVAMKIATVLSSIIGPTVATAVFGGFVCSMIWTSNESLNPRESWNSKFSD